MGETEITPAVDILKEMSKLEQQIGLKQLKIEKLNLELSQLQIELDSLMPRYETLRVEITGRFPGLEKSPEFQKKY